MLALLVMAYAANPIDLIPDFIPAMGQIIMPMHMMTEA